MSLRGGWAALLEVARQQPAGADGALPPAAGGYAVQLFQSVVALIGVCLAAWLLLRWAARRGLGRASVGRNVHVLERVVLDGRRSLYLVRVGPKVLLVGGTDGALATLAEVAPEDLVLPPASAARATPGFREVLARLRGSPPHDASAGSAREAADAAAADATNATRATGDTARDPAGGSPPGDEVL